MGSSAGTEADAPKTEPAADIAKTKSGKSARSRAGTPPGLNQNAKGYGEHVVWKWAEERPDGWWWGEDECGGLDSHRR